MAFTLPRVRWARVLIVALYVAAVLLFLQSTRQYYHKSMGFTELILFGDQFYEQGLPALRGAPHFVYQRSPGYDGQWYAQLALEPLLRNRDLDKALDTAHYRARRILFSWTAYVFGLGQPAWIIKVYAVQNIVAWLLLAWILLRWFPPTSARHFLAWFGCLYGIGMAVSFRFALLEGPGMVIIALAVWAVERQRSWLAAALLGVAGLGRETNLLAGTLLIERIPREWRAWAALAAKGLVVVVPFFLWLAYIRSVYPATNVSNPDSFGLPFSGYAQKWMATFSELYVDGWGTFARFNFAAMAGLTVQIAYLLWRREWGSAWWRVGASYCVLMPFLSYLVWEGYPGAFPRVLLPASFAFNVLVVKSRWFWPLVILGNLSVWHGLSMIGVPFLTGVL
jgi:hypothetical protein